MATRIKPPDDENWESTPTRNKRAEEMARRITLRNQAHEEDEDDGIPPARQHRQQGSYSASPPNEKQCNDTISASAQTSMKPSCKVKQKRYCGGADSISKTYSISVLCNKAMDIYGAKNRVTKSAIMHEALVAGLDPVYFEKAAIFAEIQERYNSGESFESLMELRQKLGAVTKKTQQRNMIEGATIKVCLVTTHEDAAALDFYCKEVGIPYGVAVDQCLRSYLADYLKEADDWLTFMGV